MKRQKTVSLSKIYNQEEDFSADLADNLDVIRIGSFEDAETESNVGTRRADIVAVGENGTLVVENQFGKANWDHWGRLESYARLKEADVAALVAESFEELMIVTCNLRNEDSSIDWYLIQAQANTHEELYFHHVARPAIDIQTERQLDIEYDEFWAPIRRGELGKLFMGPPMSHHNNGWMGNKTIPGVEVWLRLTNQKCYIRLYFLKPNHFERRDKIMPLFPKSEYDYEYKDTPTRTTVIFPVINKGKNDRDDWDEIREKLVAKGTDIYNRIKDSDL